MQRFKKPEFWTYPVLAVGLWAFFAFAMPDVLEFWEKNQLFRFSSDYWHFFDHEPFGTLIYLHTFLIQFSYYPWLGAIVYALLFTLTARLFNRCFETNGNRRLLPGLLAITFVLPTTTNFGLLVVMVVFLAVLGAHCWMYWKNLILRYLCQLIVLAGLTYLVREYMVWVLPFYMCLDWGRTKRSGQKFNLFFLLIPLVGTALAWILETWLCAPYDFIYPRRVFCFWGRFFAPSGCIPYGHFRPDRIIFTCMEIGAVISILWFLYQPKTQKFAWIIGIVPIACGLGFTLKHSQHISNFQKIDTLCRNYRWEEALHKIDKLWEKNPDFILTENNVQRLFCGQTKLALLATRKATNRLFSYPQPAFPMLFPTSMSNTPESFLLPTYYTFAGGFSESLHLNYDMITCHCISANVLNATIVTSLIVEDTLPAFKLTHFLEQSLFYRAQATIYKDADRRNALPAIEQGKKMLPPQNYTVESYDPDKNMLLQHLYQPENPYFYEYFLCVCLLNRKYGLIANELPTIKNFYQKGDSFVAPRYLQEAFLALFNYTPSRFMYPVKIEGVSQEVWNDYWHFVSDNQSYTYGRINFSQLQKKWKHTYWFYDLYMKVVYMSPTSQPIN